MTSPAIVPLKPQSSTQLFLRRIWAIVLRHIYLHTGSWPRIVEMMYWPVFNLLVWGFVGVYLRQLQSGDKSVSQSLVAAVLLIEFFNRTSVNIMVLFLEEIYSRNLGHLFASPIRFFDYLFGLLLASVIRMLVSIIPALLIAGYLFHFSIFNLGWMLAGYASVLVLSGCWCGLMVISLLLRFGQGAEWLCWMATLMLIPLMAPYYPVSILPVMLKAVAWSLPMTYVFEGMRAQLAGQSGPAYGLLIATGLNFAYLGLAVMVLWLSFHNARRNGRLLQVGE